MSAEIQSAEFRSYAPPKKYLGLRFHMHNDLKKDGVQLLLSKCGYLLCWLPHKW